MEQIDAVVATDMKQDTGVFVPLRSQTSEPQPIPFSEKIRKAFWAFSKWCDRLDMDDRGFWP
jgi:hypothetical protein